MADKYTQGNNQSFEDTINNSIKSLKGLDSQIDKTDRKLGNTTNVFKRLEDQVNKVAGKVDSVAKAYKNLSDVDLSKLKNAKIPVIKKEEVNAWENYAKSLKGIADAFGDMKDNMPGADAKSYNALKNLLNKIEKIDNSTIGRISTIANELNKLGKIDFNFADNTKTSFNKVISLLKEVRKITEDGAGIDKLNDMLNETLDTITDIVNKIEESKGLSSLLEHQQTKNTNKQLEKQLELKEKLVDKEKELSDIKDERKKKDNADKLTIKQANDRLQAMKGMLDVTKVESNYSIKSEDIRAKLEENIAKNPANRDKFIAESTYKLGVNNADMQMDTNLVKSQVRYNDIIKKLTDNRNELIKSGEFTEKEQEKYNRNIERLNEVYKRIIENETNKRNNIVSGLSQARALQLSQAPKAADRTFINQSAVADRAFNNRNTKAEEKKIRSDIHAENILNDQIQNSLSDSLSKDVKNILLKGLNTRLGGMLRQSETLQTMLTGSKVEEIKNRQIKAKSDYIKEIGIAEYEHELEKSAIEKTRRQSDLQVNRKFSLGQLTKDQLEQAKQGITSKAQEKTKASVEKLAAKKAAAATKQTATLTAAQGEMATVAAGAASSMAVLAAGIGAAVVSTKLMIDAANKAAKSNESVVRSLAAFGEIDEKTAKEMTEYDRTLDSIKNKFNDIIVTLGQGSQIILKPFVEMIDDLLGAGNRANTQAGKADTRFSTGIEAKSQGFASGTAENMTDGIYELAAKFRDTGKYSTDINQIAADLTEAVFSGSKVANKYGINVDKDTMTGYKVENDINPYVQYTDAAESAFRYQALLEQASKGNTESTQQQIKDWKELGTVIEATKNQLFSFDKVITMQPINPYIPDVSKGGVVDFKSLEKTEKKADDVNKRLAILKGPNKINIDFSQVETATGAVNVLNRGLGWLSDTPTINLGVNMSEVIQAQLEVQKLMDTLRNTRLAIGPQVERTSPSQIPALPNLQPQNQTGYNFGKPGSLVPTRTSAADQTLIQKGARSYLNGIQSVDKWLLDSGISAKAEELNKKLFSEEMQRNYGLAGLGILGAPFAAGAAGSAIQGAAGSGALEFTRSLLTPLGSYDTGGIITKDHVANVHAGELFIPPNGAAAKPIFKEIGEGIAESMGGAGGGIGEIHLHLGENGMIVDGNNAVDKFVRILDAKLTQLRKRRGDSNYGSV